MAIRVSVRFPVQGTTVQLMLLNFAVDKLGTHQITCCCPRMIESYESNPEAFDVPRRWNSQGLSHLKQDQIDPWTLREQLYLSPLLFRLDAG